jgi:hypothetical protein
MYFLVCWAIQQRKLPSEFGDSDLARWAQEKAREGRSDGYISWAQREFRKTVADLGLAAQFPHLSPHIPRLLYGVPFGQLPEQLQQQIAAVLKWKQDPLAEGRSRRAKHRAVTARALKESLCRLYGHATKICGL